MRTPIIVVSLIANTALVLLMASQPELAPAGLRDWVGRYLQAEPDAPVKKSAVRRAAPPEKTSLWLKLRDEDPRTFIARLRAAGFPPALIRALVSAEINARYDGRFRALQEQDPNTPFWKLRPSYFMQGDKRLEEMNLLYRERSRVLRELFNDDFFATEDVTASQRRQFGELSASKIETIQRIEDDYTEMMSAIRASMQGIVLPEDREKLALLAREKRADLAAVLTPQELADYELRTSPTTSMLRHQLAGFDPSESEFRALFQAQQNLNGKFPGTFQSVNDETRTAAQRAFHDEVRAALGEARYSAYIRETTGEFQQLNRIAQKASVPRDTATQAFDVRESVAQESGRIFDDPALSGDAKRSALQQLAQSARTRILATLGPAAGPEYLKIAEAWLTQVERGSAVSFDGAKSMMVTNDFGSFGFSGGPQYRRVTNSSQPGR
jgi:hypothetical protein